MTYDIRLTGHSARGTTESIDLVASADADLAASSVVPRTSDYTYDGNVRGYDALDPEDGFAYDQDSWEGGAGLAVQPRRGVADNRYATANGVITFTPGSFSSGYYEETVPLPDGLELVPDTDPDAETKNVWSNSVLFNGALHIGFHKYVLKYENGELAIVYTMVHGETITDLAVYQNQLIIGHKANTIPVPLTQDQYSRFFYTALDTNYGAWRAVKVIGSDPNLEFASTDPVAERLAVVRNADNSYSLACVGANGYHQTNDPRTISWTQRVNIGQNVNSFTSMTVANDTVYVGSNEGLFAYSADTNSWVDIEPGLGLFEHVNRYSRVLFRNGGLYVARFDHNLWRIDDSPDGATFTELRTLVNFPAWIGMSGNITAMAQDSNALYCMMSESPPETGRFPYAFPYEFGRVGQSTYTLIAITDNDQASHVLAQTSFATVDHMKRYAAGTNVPSELLIFGTSLAGSVEAGFSDPLAPKVVRLLIPPDEDTPYRSNARIPVPDGQGGEVRRRVPCHPEGSLNTQWFDFFFPDVQKVLVGVSIDAHWGGSPETTKQTQVKVQYRDENNNNAETNSEWSDLGSTNTPGFTTIENSTGRPILFNRVRFRIVLDTDLRVPVRVDSFVVHAMFGKPYRKRHQLLFNFVQNARDYTNASSDSNPMWKRRKLGQIVRNYPVLTLDFNRKGHLHWLEDREEGDVDPRFVRVRRFEDDLQSKGRFDTRTALEFIEIGVGGI